MNAVEFTAELCGSATLTISPEIATQLPNTGTARVIVLTAGSMDEESEWRAAAYAQFLTDEAPEDATYDLLR